MTNNLDGDLQGLLKALAALVLAFGCVVLLLSLLGPTTVEHPLG